MSIQRTDPPLAGTEKDVLLSFADFLRETILFKLEGLDDDQLRQPHDPSGLTLLGMTKHLAYVERYWFQKVFLGNPVDDVWTPDDPDADWRIEADDTTAAIVDLYRQQIALSNRIVREHDLEEPARNAAPDMKGTQLRYILVHMIEETGRHCGHADLIREAIDGQTGE